MGGRVIYSYRIVDRRYVVEENKAEIVKRIFDEIIINKKKLVEWPRGSTIPDALRQRREMG